jgi:putative membrane protein
MSTGSQYLSPSIQKNDKRAKWIIISVSIVVFLVVASLRYLKMNVNLGFDVHIFAAANASINATVTVLLIAGLVLVKAKNYKWHKNVMLLAMVLSVLFLVSYIAYHLFSKETTYPQDAPYRSLYFFILGTHIVLAGVILPFILFTAYRALVSEFPQHKKLARITWPVWFYVALTGVIVYLMISPYYTV